MSSKSQNWLTGDVGKALLHFLPALAFILFMINFSNNNQSQSSTKVIDYNAQIERNTRMNEDEQRRRDSIERTWDSSKDNNDNNNY